jgi:histidinol-phosphate aminotransferase
MSRVESMSSISQQQKRFWSPSVRELAPYVPGEQPKIANLVKLNTNENPYPPSAHVVDAVQALLLEQADVLRLYPDPDASALKQAIAQQQQIDPAQVFVGNGSDEVLAHIFKAFFVQDKPILFADISYSFYPVYSQFFNLSAVKRVPLAADFSIQVDDYLQDNGGIMLCNPNAPTGRALALTEIQRLLDHNPDSVVVIDEAYVDFGAQSAVGLLAKYDNLVICQTTSKSRSLAGLRVGYAMAQPHLIAALETVKNSFNSYPIDRLAMAAAIASFEDQAYFESTCQRIVAHREQLLQQMQALGFMVLPSQANFIFVQHPQHQAEVLAAGLRQHGVIVRHFRQPRIENFLRITVGTPEQNQALLDALKSML